MLINGIIDSIWIGSSPYILNENQNEIDIVGNSTSPNSIVTIKVKKNSIVIRWIARDKNYDSIDKKWKFPLHIPPTEVLNLVDAEARALHLEQLRTLKMPPWFPS